MVFKRLSNSCKLFFLLQAQLCMQWKFGFRVINHWRFAPTYCRCTLEFYFTLFLRKCRNYQLFFFQLMKLGQKMLGKKLFGEIMKRTFYGQFVAGPVHFFLKVQANVDQAWLLLQFHQMLIRHCYCYNSRTLLASRRQSRGCTALVWRASWTTAWRKTSARRRLSRGRWSKMPSF